MSDGKSPQEPSMEEILASVRRIISEDEEPEKPQGRTSAAEPIQTVTRRSRGSAGRLERGGFGRGSVGAIVVVIVVVLVGAVLARDRVFVIWPQAAQLYALAGLVEAAPAQPLTLRNVTQSSSIEGERLVVVVTGEIVNESANPREIPSLVAEIVDKDQRVLKSWVFDPKRPPLGPGESTAFTDRFEDPPEGAATVTYSWPSER